MERFGYTYTGVTFSKSYDLWAYGVCYIVVVFLLVLLAVIVLRHKKNTQMLVEQERVAIENELSHSNMGERQYLKKKNAQTQSYIENVAHQVRTPLTNVMLNINMIYDEQTEENKAVLDECNYHVERVNKLMDRLLKIGRLEAGKVVLEKQDENLAGVLRRIAKQHNNIQAHTEDVIINMDYDWMYEAFSCLIDNCMEHSEPETEINVRLLSQNSKAIVIIEDNGDGFSEDDLPYLFERFYSDSRYKATGHYGIGLNLARMIIEAHYGTIKAYNRECGGAGFRIEIPILMLKNKTKNYN